MLRTTSKNNIVKFKRVSGFDPPFRRFTGSSILKRAKLYTRKSRVYYFSSFVRTAVINDKYVRTMATEMIKNGAYPMLFVVGCKNYLYIRKFHIRHCK